MPPKRIIDLTVNGRPYEIAVSPRLLLADLLRDELSLTGTHIACEQGRCGACTVLVDGRAIYSCLMLAVQATGSSITTVEGVSPDGMLTAVQQAFHDNHGLQCGFCTSGLVVSLHGLLRENPKADEAQLIELLAGHICRCTGYQNIVKAAKAAAAAVGGGQP